MRNLVVVDNPKTWKLTLPDVPIVAARSYLTEPEFARAGPLRVFNLCKSYRYQSLGYYVSLLAMARGHRPLPSIITIQDMKSLTIARIVADDLEELIQSSLKALRSDLFTLSIYFGQNTAARYEQLAARIFRLFEAPFLRVDFRCEDGEWTLDRVRPISVEDIPDSHIPFVLQFAREFFASKRLPARRSATERYEMAILTNPDEERPPSNAGALKRMGQAAKRAGMATEFITREDFGKIGEFDALFIRETTAVHHHTYRFARRAAADGVVVIDDPDSIAKCSNKVFLYELLNRNRVRVPDTLILHRENFEELSGRLGWPVVLKQPDSAFSQGVTKVDSPSAYQEAVSALLDKSDLVLAQEFKPTEFDWRIGVLAGRVLYACKYHMAGSHWQIAQVDGGEVHYGRVEALPLGDVPSEVLNTARRAAALIGDGLYGVDMKVLDGHPVVIEINDNPNIDAGFEDRILGDALYDAIVQYFINRIELRRAPRDV